MASMTVDSSHPRISGDKLRLALQANYLAAPHTSFCVLLTQILNHALEREEVGEITLLETHLVGKDIEGSLGSGHPKLRRRRLRFPAAWAQRLGSLLPQLSVESLAPGADVFHSIHIYPSPLPVRIPCVVTIHDVMPVLFPELAEPSASWTSAQIRRWCGLAAAVVVDSEITRRDLLRLFDVEPERVVTIHPGIDSRFKPIEPDRRMLGARYGLTGDYVLYLGAIGRQKNVEALVEAFSILSRRLPDLKLVLAGRVERGGYAALSAIERLSLGSRVRMIESLPALDRADDLVHLYAGARVFATASLYEGFGMPPLEAMACGTPVVSSNAGSLPEALGDAAVFSDPSDVNGFAEAISRLIQDDALHAEHRRLGFARAAEFGAEKMARSYVDLFLRIKRSNRP